MIFYSLNWIFTSFIHVYIFSFSQYLFYFNRTAQYNFEFGCNAIHVDYVFVISKFNHLNLIVLCWNLWMTGGCVTGWTENLFIYKRREMNYVSHCFIYNIGMRNYWDGCIDSEIKLMPEFKINRPFELLLDSKVNYTNTKYHRPDESKLFQSSN